MRTTVARSSPVAIATLDTELFTAAWFALDAGNQRVPGVVIPSLETGLALIGDGAVATIVGRLRDPYVCVDVDLDGLEGDAVTEHIASWAEKTGLWVLTRPSGGAPGRAHVIIACPPPQRPQLEQLLADLRATYRAPASRIDLRTAIRPLSAPHRTGGQTRPYGNLTRLAKTLPRRTKGSAATAKAVSGRVEPLVPRPRRRRDLPEAWANYLATGRTPVIGGSDRSRSTVEAIATGHMLRAGWSPDEAWQAICTAHPAAMDRARGNRARWVQWVWNRAVRDDPSPKGPPPAIEASVTAAREQLHRLQWTVPPRQRAALTAVGHAILDRIWRTGTLHVPVPERDLVLDTGITRRPTIRSALKVLGGSAGIGRLHTDPYQPTNKHSSHEFELTPDQGVLQLSPPSSHTPSPPASHQPPAPVQPQVWHTLPRTARGIWHLLHHRPGSPLETLVSLAGCTTHPDSTPTASHLRTVRRVLTALAEAGLAHCDAAGRWTPVRPAEQPDTTRYAAVAQQVAAERSRWRESPQSRWHQQRRTAIAADHARYRRWWDSLDPVTRHRRAVEHQDRFARSSLTEQCRLKTRLARSRALAGMNEAARHDQWCADLGPEEYEARSLDRAAVFERLPVPLQRAFVAAWADHRSMWSTPCGYTFHTGAAEAAA